MFLQIIPIYIITKNNLEKASRADSHSGAKKTWFWDGEGNVTFRRIEARRMHYETL